MSNGLESTKYLITKIIHVNMKTLALNVENLLERFKFSKSRPNSKVKFTRPKMLMPTERPRHKEYSFEISSSSTHCSDQTPKSRS